MRKQLSNFPAEKSWCRDGCLLSRDVGVDKVRLTFSFSILHPSSGYGLNWMTIRGFSRAKTTTQTQNTCCRYLQSSQTKYRIILVWLPNDFHLSKWTYMFMSCHRWSRIWIMTHSDCGLLVDKLSWSWPSSEPGWWSSCQVRWAVWCWVTCWTTATARRGRPSWRSAQHWRSSRVSTRSNSNVRLESAGKPCPRYWMNTQGKLKLKVMRSY